MIARQPALAVALAGVVTLLAACQAVPASPQNGSTASSAQSTPDPTASPTARSEPTNDLGQPTRTPDRKVSVRASARRYAPGALISVVVANGLDRTIFTDDSKADCSIIILQRLEGTTWDDVPGCAQQRPPATVAIGPAHSRTVSLQPASSNFRIGAGPEPALKAGAYRAKYTYRFTPEQADNDPLSILSDPFTID
jgi:hypothetical protein